MKGMMGAKSSGGMGGKSKGKSGGQPGLGKKIAGFSSKVGKTHKAFGKSASPAGK